MTSKQYGTLALLLALSFGVLILPAALKSRSTDPRSSAAISGNSQVMWGSWIDGSTYGTNPATGQPYGDAPYDSATWNLFESNTQKKVSILHFGQPWYRNGAWFPFNSNNFNTIRTRGAIPMIDFGSWDYCCGRDQSTWALKNITAGTAINLNNKTSDQYLTEWATAAKNWGNPFFLRFDWEMNGNWQFPWSTGIIDKTTGARVNNNTPQDYINAWKHVRDIFTKVGATNASWVWCPNISGSSTVPYDQLYPGDGYVDWSCLDGYNQESGSNWQSFGKVFGGSSYNGYRNSYQEILNIAPSKPIMIGEFASKECISTSTYDCVASGTTKAAWIKDALTNQLPNNFPRIKAIVWFNWNDNDPTKNWPIESSAASQAAFSQAINSNYYTSNDFSGIDQNPIPEITGQTPTVSPTSTSTITPIPTLSPTPTEIISTNAIKNPSFENTGVSWSSPWSFLVKTGAAANLVQDASSAYNGIYSARINVTTGSTVPWYVQLRQNNIPLTQSAPIKVSFAAKGSVARNINLVIQQSVYPYKEYVNRTFTISQAWQQYSFDFTPVISDANTTLSFNVAQTTGAVWIDSTSITPSKAISPILTPTNVTTPTNNPTPTSLCVKKNSKACR